MARRAAGVTGDTVAYGGGLGWSSSNLVPLAPGASGASLRGVSCISATHCEAAGWSLFGGTPTGLIETFS